MNDGFLWGVATSSHQIEGNNHRNDWWEFEQAGRIEGGARSGIATDHWNRFREDLRLAAELGINSYRFSIEWSRIEPEEGRWDPVALAWYEDLISECERLGMIPMLTLHHFTSPLWFAKKGGFTWSQAPERFARFTCKIAETLGPRVPLWCTLNEPMVLAGGTYLAQIMPPAEFAPAKASLASAQMLKAHVMAYDILHSRIPNRAGPWKARPIEVGIAHNMLDFMPDRAWHPIEQVLSKVFRRFYNTAWLDAVTGRRQHFGVPGFVPYPIQIREALGRRTVDFLGINYYTKAYVQWRPRDAAEERPAELPLGLAFARRKEEASDLGWAVHPEGFRRVLKHAARYGLPLYVTENGIADRGDRLRSAYLLSHIEVLDRLRAQGLDLRGYYHWSLLDNFEWIKGFGPRFGLYQVDYETLERRSTSTVDLYRKLIQR